MRVDADGLWPDEPEAKCERLAYSLKEVAAMLGVSQGHLRHEQRRSKLEFFHSGRRTLILASELRRYIAR